MNVISPSYEIKTPLAGTLERIEEAGRTCYQSEAGLKTYETTKKFVSMLIKRGHHSVLEHAGMTIKFITDRGVTHELVRHRLTSSSYSQESTRYCNYSKRKFGNEITVVSPAWFMTDGQYDEWYAAMLEAERHYFTLLSAGAPPEMARSVLPNSLKTTIIMTTNIRDWRHFFTLRADKAAHPQMRELVCPLLRELRTKVPVLFDDVGDPEADAWTVRGE